MDGGSKACLSGWVRAIVGIVAFFVALAGRPDHRRAAGPHAGPQHRRPGRLQRDHRRHRRRPARRPDRLRRDRVRPDEAARVDHVPVHTRTIVLIPIAIAINIILGQTVAAALKVPIYLDSIGTILVGVLAGPIAGAITGGLANLIWTYVLPAPFQSAVRRAVLHRRRRDRARRRHLRPARLLPEPPEHAVRTGSRSGRSSSALIVAVIGIYGFIPFYSNSAVTFFAPPAEGSTGPDPIFVFLGWVVALLLIAAVLGPVRLLFIRRDLGAAYVFVAGLAVRDHLGDHLRADLGPRVRRRHRLRHGPPRRGVPAGRRRPPDRRPQAGPAVRPDRQDAHVLRRLRHPRRAEPALLGPVPAG